MEYTEVIAECMPTKLAEISEKIAETCEIELIKHPSEGMVMTRLIDPLEKTPFYIGEALVTECEVSINGVPGYSFVIGKQEERALYGAVIDAVMHSEFPVRAEIQNLLDEEAAKIIKRWNSEENMVSSTRVNFEVR